MGDLLLDTVERTAADKENVSGIDGLERNHRIFAVGSHRNFDVAALEELQHSLLYGFSADVSLVCIFLFRNLVDLVNEDDTVLRALHIVVCGR